MLQHSRWSILQAVSHNPSSATDISERTDGSLPNVTQQLKLLEAHDLVRFRTARSGQAGKPRKIFSLRRAVCHITFARQGFAGKRLVYPDQMQEMLISTFFLPSEDQRFIIKALLCNQDILEQCSLAFLSRPGTDIEMFALTGNVEEIRERYSNINVDCGNVGRKIALWTHNEEEVKQGILNKEPYYLSLIQDMQVLHDPSNRFQKVVE